MALNRVFLPIHQVHNFATVAFAYIFFQKVTRCFFFHMQRKNKENTD